MNTPSPLGALGMGARLPFPPFPLDWLHRPSVPELDEEMLALAWELARLVHPFQAERARQVLLLSAAVLVSSSRGSTRSSHGVLRGLMEELAGAAAAQGVMDAVAQPDASLSSVLGPPGSYVPLIAEPGYLALQRMHALETQAAAHLITRLTHPNTSVSVDSALKDVLARPAFHQDHAVVLNDEQKTAVVAACTRRLSVITGGPGTGKTALVVSLLRTLVRLPGVGVAGVALAAPTGKAADRMRQGLVGALSSVRERADADEALLTQLPPAQTLHRLLGWSPGAARFRHHAENPLDVHTLVVDESSMMDVTLVERVLAALPAHAHLVLLGDAEQLPSVEPGAVFRDLCGSGADAVVRLTRSYRMDPTHPAGRAILLAAGAINAGTPADLWDESHAAHIPVTTPQEARFSAVELVGDLALDARTAFLERWFSARAWNPLLEARIHQGCSLQEPASALAVLRHHESSRLLCALREGPRLSGVAEVNRWCRARLARQRGITTVHGFLPGEPIMVQSNDYTRNLFNGDGGVVLPAREEPSRLCAVFRRGDDIVEHSLASVAPLVEPAWATTVHKAQGSEFDHVALMLPSADTRSLTRELLYTAMTRARESVTLVGSRDTVDAAAARPAQRDTALRHLLTAAVERGAAGQTPAPVHEQGKD